MASLAAGAIDLAEERRNLDAALDVLPYVDVDELAIHLVQLPGKYLERLRRLETGHDIDDGRKHSRGFASARLSRRRRSLEHTAQAGSLSGQNGHGLAVTADAA